ncbi:hypothetical protein [Selenomonas sputigena]|uniref:Uncharacterized protein n=1 Tax=Selenomonas sputigena (strain ATCC 35185 / DSM 20758 / CCUG 44933 / VPI D19B-28) TaxID=546271 RepID=C9LU54_SELS3|nr:hypothetical protein [Selenomonas sputigena]AEC00319.1 hypothetical protein Selsp_1360 [Selenomonas sputigena ATCC 35185]EEX77585.1 hypothetical protein SELSPUOL_00861 [Selenomonas sputigena ATCC 35185]
MERSEKVAMMETFTELTRDLIQLMKEEKDIQAINPDLIREIRENVREILDF